MTSFKSAFAAISSQTGATSTTMATVAPRTVLGPGNLEGFVFGRTSQVSKYQMEWLARWRCDTIKALITGYCPALYRIVKPCHPKNMFFSINIEQKIIKGDGVLILQKRITKANVLSFILGRSSPASTPTTNLQLATIFWQDVSSKSDGCGH